MQTTHYRQCRHHHHYHQNLLPHHRCLPNHPLRPLRDPLTSRHHRAHSQIDHKAIADSAVPQSESLGWRNDHAQEMRD